MEEMVGESLYFYADVSFGFVQPTSDTPGVDRNYILLAIRDDKNENLVIVVKNDEILTSEIQGKKIGELAEGMNKLSELDELIDRMNHEDELTFTFKYEEESIKLITIIIGALLSFLILVLYLLLCLYL